jgi:hypothetical protein
MLGEATASGPRSGPSNVNTRNSGLGRRNQGRYFVYGIAKIDQASSRSFTERTR